jgi:hypothetical protein
VNGGREIGRVVGQTLRYIGQIKKKWANENQRVYGSIIACKDDPK